MQSIKTSHCLNIFFKYWKWWWINYFTSGEHDNNHFPFLVTITFATVKMNNILSRYEFRSVFVSEFSSEFYSFSLWEKYYFRGNFYVAVYSHSRRRSPTHHVDLQCSPVCCIFLAGCYFDCVKKRGVDCEVNHSDIHSSVGITPVQWNPILRFQNQLKYSTFWI